jgi:hypothetical protein
MAVKPPYKSVISGVGTVGIGVPSQVMVILELGENPEPTRVVDANPSSGIRVNISSGTNLL